MIACINLAKYRRILQNKIDEVILDYKIRTTREQRAKVQRIIITSAMITTALIVISSGVAYASSDLNKETQEILYYHFKKLHYSNEQIQQCINAISQSDVDKIVKDYNFKLDHQIYPYDVRKDLDMVMGGVVYLIISELFRSAVKRMMLGG